MNLPIHEPRCQPDQPGDYCRRCARYIGQPWQIIGATTPQVRVLGPWSPTCMRVAIEYRSES